MYRAFWATELPAHNAMTLTNRNAGARGPVGTINSLVPEIPGAGVLERIPELNPAKFYHKCNHHCDLTLND